MSLNPLFAAKDNYVPRPFGYFEYLALQGIPHGLKPPPSHLTVPAPYGIAKPVGRNVMSPVQTGPHANTAFSPFGNNVNPALNATRTSSFAAALRKLAKQAIDPVAEKELSPISPASSPASSQQSSHSRHHAPLPMYINSHNSNPPIHASSPPVAPLQNSQGKALDLGRYTSSSRNGNEPVSLKIENSKLLSSNDKRSDGAAGNKHMAASSIPISLRHEHAMSSRGFQPYRNSEERHSTPPQIYNPSPPPTTVSGYAYHPSFAQSSQLAPQPYRLEESVYMERYGLLRPSALPYPPSSNILPHPRAPPYPSSHYPPELLPQSIRPVPINSSSYPPSRYAQDEENAGEVNLLRKREMELYRDHERYLEREEERECREREIEYLRKDRALVRQSPVSHPHSSSRTEASNEEKGHMGSITHGTPRDFARRLSPPSSSSSIPLNLATNINNLESEMPSKDEYSARHSRQQINSIVNGQVHHRSGSHPSSHSYRKENDASSYRMHYQISTESHQKSSSIPTENVESSVTVPMPAKAVQYYSEREYQKPDVVETRTLSMASVINSQINGIFAREKFVSNNSYDYLSSLAAGSEKNSAPENQNKSKTEFKSIYPSQENYLMHPKFSNNEKIAQDNSSFDTVGNKLPPFMLSDNSFPLSSDSNNYSQPFKIKEPSLTRALLQNHSSVPYANDAHPLEDSMPKIVSTLDAREAKMRKLRKTGDFVESDESELDSDEEDELRFKRLLTITKGPPPKLNPDPKKTQFLSSFGLVTHTKKQFLEIKKCIRRHQVLREKSCSPVAVETVKEPQIEYDSKHLAELSKRLCFAEDFQAKTEFLQMLGLVYLSAEQKAEKEKIQRVIEDERLRRNGCLKPSQRCVDLQGSNLRKRSYSILHSLKPHNVKKPNTSLCENNKPNEVLHTDKLKRIISSMKTSKSPTTSVQRLSAFLKPPMRTVNLPVPPLIPASQVIPNLADNIRDSSTAVVVPKDPRVRQIDKDFVQEFHNSVLQTTQMQLEKKYLPNSSHLESSFHKSSPTNTTSEKADWSQEESKSVFRWPGIEAIMESYECHITEQSVEKKFLTDSCQKLKALIQESNTKIECLGHKTEELMQEKKLLEFERKELQNSVESLKLFIQHFR